jgi:putrescine transport system ATP-binding protein
MAQPLIVVDRVRKAYGPVRAVDEACLEIAGGEFFALLGPSGCGKTTLMRLIAGFERPDSGRIIIEGRDIAGDPPHRRPVNMMFQSYALFPHMNVAKNVGFALRRQGMSAGAAAERVRDMLRLVQLEGLGERRPDQLSGGQKARVALARALAGRPKLLLLDEPLAALDRKLREETQFELMQVQRDLGLSFLVVTHDQDEAMAMAQRIAVMRDGRIEQIGAARDVYERPASRWVARFIGDANVIEGDVREVSERDSGAGRTRRTVIEASGLRYTVVEDAADTPSPDAGARVGLAVRAERIELAATQPQAENCLEGEVMEIAYLGDVTAWRVRCAGGLLLRVATLNQAGALRAERGDKVFLSWPASAGRVLAQ